jgi:spore germination cell wall hydrolase CwlJ-like protein
MFSNRTLSIAVCVIVGIILVRTELRISNNEERMERIENKLDDIIQTRDTVKYTPAERDCLTKNIYYEAGVEDIRGKYAVAHVTLNRLKTGRWGNDICSVVYAKSQFSWTLLKKLPRPDSKLWAESREVAVNTLNGARVSGLTKSLYYHAIYIKNPRWVDIRHEAGQIGNHIFYNRAKGSNVAI